MKTLKKSGESSINRLFFLSAIIWTIVLACLLGWNFRSATHQVTELAVHEARAFFEEIVVTRNWNSSHGGVYVPITENTPPNPYLKVPNRDLMTVDGLALTMLNPTYMNRQIGELASRRNNIWYHITSAAPLRPENVADHWEMEALARFSAGVSERFEFLDAANGKKIFRYMAPLWAERECLECHLEQGYSEGDLRGGVSVTVEAEPILAAMHRQVLYLGIAYLIIWLLGLLGISVSRYRLSREKEGREKMIVELQNAFAEVKTLSGLLPICASCKKVRDDAGYWNQIEGYFRDHTEVEFTHGICPECAKRLYPEFDSAAS